MDAVVAAAGLAMLVWTVTLFVRVGRGTLAPWDPTRRLVARGPYARVRNPMISGVLAIIVGEAAIRPGVRGAPASRAALGAAPHRLATPPPSA